MPEQPEPTTSVPARPAARRQVSRLARVGLVFFVIGLLAVAVILVLFATGSTELPLWLNLVAMLAPVGFGLGLLGVYGEARAARRSAAARRHARATSTVATHPGSAG